MKTSHPSQRMSVAGILAIAICGCSGDAGTGGSGGTNSSGGATSQPGNGGSVGSGGQPATGGRSAAGGSVTTGGTTAAGGSPGSGGATGVGGVTTSGGTMGTGGQTGAGGAAGSVGRDGGPDVPAGTGGGGAGGAASGGRTGAGGAATGGATTPTTSTVDCSATLPSGGTDHCGQNTQGTAGGLSWSLWSNNVSSSACITTYSTPAFSARWSGNNDFLARIGLEFGNSGKTYDQYGTIAAQFSYKKTGTAGGYSYIGIYGWSTNPCVEWYIIDDSYGTMPFNAYGGTLKGTVSIDGESYKLFSNTTTGSGGSRCTGVSSWGQFWSIRQKARQCGTITISDHFKAWDAAGMKMGNLLEAKILVETGGGTGNIDFPVANVTKSQ